MILGIVKTKGTKFFSVDSLSRKDGYWSYSVSFNFIPSRLGFYVWIERW